ncbi:hypothetical protein PPYR_08444 [Photinus pyralis]|uniref:Putative nuclease HARBI1 n=1 Tax=Photinus pyralis TaxID=7054 RepID=A0A5N4AJC8_PHOPY|nr:hypothetical protein PPYR_08444 [Photinus pyralis]
MELVFIIDVLENEIVRRQLNLQRRQLRDHSDPLTLPEITLLAQWVLDQILPHMRDSARTTAIPKGLRFFAALHFLSHGSYQRGVGQDYLTSMHQTSVSRCLTEVTDILVQVLGHLIKFPETEVEKNQEKQRFVDSGGFPGIIGCIDCTQVAIIAPKTEDPEMPGVVFYCRKQYYSLNICNTKLKILNINARFPGSVHDSAIWQTSLVRRHLVNNFRGNGRQMTYLLGDAGYPLEPWLLTPIANPVTNSEREYNRRHKTIRNIIERTNGLLKQRFRCLLKHRTLHYAPERAAQIIYAAAIMHNLCIDRNEYLGDINDNCHEEENNNEVNNNNQNADEELDLPERNVLHQGRIVRNRVVENYCL